MTIRAVLFDANGADREVDLVGDGRPKLGEKQLLWVDLDDRGPDELRAVAETIGLEAEGLDRLRRDDRQARLLRLPDRVAEGHVDVLEGVDHVHAQTVGHLDVGAVADDPG